MRRFLGNLALIASLVAGLSACAAGVGDVDFTQPDKLSKSLFEGEWYYRPIISEVQYDGRGGFEGLQGDMSRVKWRIDERLLTAYRSHELVDNMEMEEGDLEFLGNPVAQFRIESHFDVMRGYNPNTGDQSNKIVEDTRTRPWYERDYMRVDWSVNLLRDPSSIEGFITYWAQAAYYKQENEVDDYHRVDIKEERHPDTNEVLAASINVTGHYWSQVDPRFCSYYTNNMECGAAETKMKMSFMRIIGESDYEPLYYPDYLPIYKENGDELIECSIVDETNCSRRQEPMFARFGYFRTERQAYDDEYQITRHNRIFLINRHNIWNRSHFADGSVIPMKDRDAGKITYYTNPDIPTDDGIKAGTALIAQDWDTLFRKTVAARKSLNGTPVNWETDIEPIFEILENSCNVENATTYAATHKLEGVLAKYGIATIAKGNLKRACAVLEYASGCDKPENNDDTCRPDQYDITPRFDWQKHGDVRYNFAHWVDTPMGGPLGYGPSSADPLSGEIISATSNIYGASVDYLAAYAADLVTMMNGDTSVADMINGTHIREAMGQNSQQMQPGMGRDMFSIEKMKQMNEASGMQNELPFIMNEKQPEMAARMALEDVIGQEPMHPDMENQARQSARAKLQRVQGSYIDTELLTNDELRRGVIGATHYQPDVGMIAGADEDFTALDWVLDGEEFMAGKKELDKHLAEKTIMMAEWFADEGMASIASELSDKSWDEIYDFMRSNIYRTVQTHEVGHTVGLRHNFGGSMDPLNFKPGFWDDYNPDTRQVDRVDANGNPTKAERFMYSSIMDYDSRFYADMLEGLGQYDNAAIHFGYGQLVEVFDHDSETPGPQSDLALGYQNLFFFHDYNNIPLWFDGDLSCASSLFCHPDYLDANGYYQDYNSAYNNSQDESLTQEQRDLAEYEADMNYSQYNRYLNSYYKNAAEGRTPMAEKINQRTMIPFEEVYAEWTDYWRDVDYAIPFDEVPYEFCPDEYSWASNVSCQVFDKGANFTEAIQDRALRHNAYYYISNFKRDKYRWGYSTRSYLNRLQSRYFGPMSTIYRYYLYGSSGLGFDKNGDYLRYTDFPFGRDWQGAAMEGLNYLNSVLNQPEAGMHCLVGDTYKHWDDGQGNLLPGCESGETMEIPLGVGKPLRTTWTDEYMYKPTSIGFYWDKLVAMLSMTSNEGSFVRDLSDYLDSGTFSLSYWRTLQPQMMDVFGSAFGTGESPYGWHTNDEGQLISKPVVDIYDEATMPDFGTMTKVESPWTWTLRYWAVVLPFTRFNSMFDYTADFSQYAKVCLDGYMDCMTFTDDNGVAQVETYVDPITNYTYIAPGDLAGAQSVVLNLESQIVSDPANEQLQADLAEAQNGTKMMLGARMLREAQDYANTVYAPALAAWEAAKLTYEADPSEANTAAYLDATYALDTAERGVHENTSFLDIIRDLGRMTEYGGGW